MKYKNRVLISVMVLIITLMVVVLLTREDEDTLAEMKKIPHNQPPVLGTWSLSKTVPLNNKIKNISIPKEIYFSDEMVAFGDTYTFKPKYKAKYINIESYLRYKYNDTSWKNFFSKNYQKIINISDGQNFYQDIFIMNDKKLAFVMNTTLCIYDMKNQEVSNSVLMRYEQEYKTSSNGITGSYESDMAVLLGIRSKKMDDNNQPVISYRTYLIRVKDEKKKLVYLTKDLFFPRSDGFWTAKYNVEMGEKGTPRFYTMNISPKAKEDANAKFVSSQPFELDYLGPNYFSIQTMEKDNSKSYNIVRMDPSSILTGVSIVDIAGEEGLSVLKEQINSNTNNVLNAEGSQNLEAIKDAEYNIGLRRASGKWEFVTNLRYFAEDAQKHKDLVSKDITINIVPTVDIALSFELPMKWTNVRNLVPSALDAIASPDKHYIIVQDTDELLMYDASNDKIILSIPIEKTDQIVLSEWALSTYAEKWEKAFKQTERVPVSYSED